MIDLRDYEPDPHVIEYTHAEVMHIKRYEHDSVDDPPMVYKLHHTFDGRSQAWAVLAERSDRVDSMLDKMLAQRSYNTTFVRQDTTAECFEKPQGKQHE